MRRVVPITWLIGSLLFALSCASNTSVGPTSRNANNREPQSSADTAVWKPLEAFAQEGCVFNDPSIKGSTNQGGYAFEYESRSGTGPTGACRWYRLRNTPGKLYTPVRWKDSVEIWFDTALAGCAAGSACPWIDVVKQALRTVDGRSTLSYGVNKNEFFDDPSAFKRHGDEKSLALAAFPRFVTTVSGVIADAEQRPIPIAIRVVSYVRSSTSPYKFAYEISTGPDANRLSVALNQENSSAPFRVIWGATNNKAFHAAAAEQGVTSVAGSDKQASIEFTDSTLTLNLEELLIVMQGDTPIFATSAPAYKPREEQ